MAGKERERILIIENDPVVADLIANQTLEPAGYQTLVVKETTLAVPQSLQFMPDVMLVNLDMPGLSGKDLLVALTAQRIQTPVIVMARKGMESAVIQAYRLGAADYLLWPIRESEVVNVVERVLKQVRERHERDNLAGQLEQANKELQSRMREMTTIFSIGKAVISITDQTLLFDRILEGAVKISSSDVGWFLLHNEAVKNFFLVAYQNLPPSLAAYMNDAWEDGVSSLVAMSGQALSIHGEALKNLKISTLGRAALVMPVKVQKQVIGVLVVMRKQPLPYLDGDQRLLEAITDYASISLVNARLFRALEERVNMVQVTANQAQVEEKIFRELLNALSEESKSPILIAQAALKRLEEDKNLSLNLLQQKNLETLKSSLDLLQQTSGGSALPITLSTTHFTHATLNDVVRQAVKRMQGFAQDNKMSILAEVPYEPVSSPADPLLLSHVLDGLLSNAIKYGKEGSIVVHIKRVNDRTAHLLVKDNGIGMESSVLLSLFEAGKVRKAAPTGRFGGLGISLPLVKEILETQKCQIWVESKSHKGTTFTISLPVN